MYVKYIAYSNSFFFSQGGSHRASVLDERDPFRFRHMISTDALQVRNLPSKDRFCFFGDFVTSSNKDATLEAIFVYKT